MSPVWSLALICLVVGVLSGPDAHADETGRLSEADTKQLGWNPEALDRALDYAKSLSTDTLMIVTDGVVVRSFGDLHRPRMTHSMRKALLSALVGQHAGPGPKQLDLDATLKELGIDDEPGPLSPLQSQAKVLHLIKNTSGINHAAAAEAGLTQEKDRRLGDGENAPGTVWAYNNWDHNVLTSVFESATGLSVGEAFKSGIADRIGMQDFSTASVSYVSEPQVSQHRAAMFEMSARDLASFGQLYLSKGNWRGDQVIPGSWVERIVSDQTPTGDPGLKSGHGYLWWIPGPETGLPRGTYFAWGLGQQALFVLPEWRTVVVHQADMQEFLERLLEITKEEQIDTATALERLALHCLEISHAGSDFCRDDRFILRREFDRLISLIVQARNPP